MSEKRKRERTASMIKIANQRKESKLWLEEANSHTKAGNLSKAIYSYNKFANTKSKAPKMAETPQPPTFVDKRLSITRESELLHSFVGVSDQTGTEDAVKTETAPDECPDEQNVEDSKATSATKSKSKRSTKGKNSNKPTNNQKENGKKKMKRKKKKSNVQRGEELYCDKDRAAAVNMGSRDIKQSLKLKRKEDRSKALQIPEEAEPGTFLALGNYKMNRGDLQIAIDFMTKALELNPSEKNALVARSKCYILLGQPENALRDAESALQLDGHFMKAIYQKAESLYYLGNFEYSLVYYHRGLHIRPDHEDFKLGVHKAQKAIENAIGANCFPSMRGKTTTTTTATTPTTKRSDSGLGNNSDGTRSERGEETVTPVYKKRTANKKSRMLRELGPDKEYLDNLINNPNIKCKYKENDCTIENCIRETVAFLNERQEFWRQQLPPNLKRL